MDKQAKDLNTHFYEEDTWLISTCENAQKY